MELDIESRQNYQALIILKYETEDNDEPLELLHNNRLVILRGRNCFGRTMRDAAYVKDNIFLPGAGKI